MKYCLKYQIKICEVCLRRVKPKIIKSSLNYILRFSSYIKENTLHLSHKIHLKLCRKDL